MTGIEKKTLDFIKKHYIIMFLFCIVFLGALMRYGGRNYKSADYLGFFKPWYDIAIANGQIECLKYQVGDYNVLFQCIVVIITYLPIDPLYAFKMLSIGFDFVLAVGCAACVYEISKDKEKKTRMTATIIAFCLVWLSPLVVMNSAFWGQSEAICASFTIWAMYFLMKNSNVFTFICLGCAAAFKIQVLFVVPFLVFLYVLEKKFSLLHFLISVFVAWLSSLPAILSGRSVWTFFELYGAQQGELTSMTVNFPNFWAVFGGHYEHTNLYGYMLTICIFGVALFVLLSKDVRLDTYEKAIDLFLWSIWTVVMFLPGMHDRYGYLLEVALLVAVVLNARKYIPFVLGVYVTTLITYSKYLFAMNWDIKMLAVLYSVMYVLFSYRFFCVTINNGERDCII